MRRFLNDPHDIHPGEWEGELIARDLIADDPLHHASVWTNAGFQWSELGRLLPLSSRQQRIPRSSGKFDFGEGLTIPANVPGEPSGSCSFAVRRGQRPPEQRLLCAELIGAHAFNAARRVDDHPAARVSHSISAGASRNACAGRLRARPTGKSRPSWGSVPRPRTNM
jgi:LuxR family quorum-sensing system transcriptional regulator CciR